MTPLDSKEWGDISNVGPHASHDPGRVRDGQTKSDFAATFWLTVELPGT